MAEPEAPRQEADPLVFPTSMTGPKPKDRSTAAELKKTRTAEAEARKRKHPEASATAPAKKKRMTKNEWAAPTEPLIVEPISMVHPDADPQERQLTVHEPTFTGAHEAEDFPTADPIAAEDIGYHDHDDAVLPQLEHQHVPSPVLTHSKLISIGRPLTPIDQDASWADRPQEEEDFEAQPTPTPQASLVLRRLRKGPRSPVSESEAKAAEDIPAASADEEEAPQDATPLSHQEAVLEENVTVTDPPARQVEVENLEAATTNTNEA